MAPTRRPIARAFTLIELLVVIAIIAILTAILLPVFASVREGARQSTSISNMKDIQQKMAQFKLDNHRYPDVLFGYAYPNTSMKNALAQAQADDTKNGTHLAAVYFPGLYPAYIKDAEEFTDPNNTVNSSDTGKMTGQLATNIVAPCNATNDALLSSAASACGTTAPGNVATTTRNFYLADAYDSSPQVTGTNQISMGPNVVRYQVAQEGTACSPAGSMMPHGCDSNVVATSGFYTEQLRWQNPPANTLITLTTYHVKNADKVLAIFESGAVKKMPGSDFSTLDRSSPPFWQVNQWPENLKP